MKGFACDDGVGPDDDQQEAIRGRQAQEGQPSLYQSDRDFREPPSLSGFLRAPGGIQTIQTDKYPIPPEESQTRTEWHLSSRTKTIEKRADAHFIAVMGVGNAGKAVAIDGIEDATTGERIAVQFRRERKPVMVSINPSGPSVSVR
jgi:hypothetical protein